MNALHVIVAAMPDEETTTATNPSQQTEPTYLPTGAASHVVTVTTDSPAAY